MSHTTTKTTSETTTDTTHNVHSLAAGDKVRIHGLKGRADLNGPVTDNTIPGWNTHNCEVAIVDWEGRSGVLRNRDAGGFSDVYQSMNTLPGQGYTLSFDVWATPIHNTAGNAYCTSTDSNGLMALTSGAVQMGCGTAEGFCAGFRGAGPRARRFSKSSMSLSASIPSFSLTASQPKKQAGMEKDE